MVCCNNFFSFSSVFIEHDDGGFLRAPPTIAGDKARIHLIQNHYHNNISLTLVVCSRIRMVQYMSCE